MLASAVVLFAIGTTAGRAQGHGTPNAPEAGPAAPGTESATGRPVPPESAKPKPDPMPRPGTGSDATPKEGAPKR